VVDPFLPWKHREKPWRRRRRSSAEAFDQNLTSLLDAPRPKGLYCKGCRKHRTWSQLYTSWSIISGQPHLNWHCDRCDTVLSTKEYRV